MPEDRDITAYVDGRLEGRRLRRFEERLAAEPALAVEVERQRRAVRAIDAAAVEVVAPAGLRATVAQLEREHAKGSDPDLSRRRSDRGQTLFRFGWAAGLAAAAAAAVFVVVLGGGGPAVDDALALASKPPEGRVVPSVRTPQLLREEIEGVAFPNYRAKFGWRAVGERTDDVEGREVRTVFYEKDGERIAYSIFAGDALDEPRGRTETAEGTEITVFEDEAVTWERDDHTCVLSGADEETLVELAGWKGKGNVPF